MDRIIESNCDTFEIIIIIIIEFWNYVGTEVSDLIRRFFFSTVVRLHTKLRVTHNFHN